MQTLTRLMMERGVSVDDLADKTGVSRQSIYSILNGSTAKPRAVTLMSIFTVLNLSAEDREEVVREIMEGMSDE